jgi:hypothetical protein
MTVRVGHPCDASPRESADARGDSRRQYLRRPHRQGSRARTDDASRGGTRHRGRDLWRSRGCRARTYDVLHCHRLSPTSSSPQIQERRLSWTLPCGWPTWVRCSSTRLFVELPTSTHVHWTFRCWCRSSSAAATAQVRSCSMSAEESRREGCFGSMTRCSRPLSTVSGVRDSTRSGMASLPSSRRAGAWLAPSTSSPKQRQMGAEHPVSGGRRHGWGPIPRRTPTFRRRPNCRLVRLSTTVVINPAEFA